MCGIFAFLCNRKISDSELMIINQNALHIKHRGPDNSCSRLINSNIYLMFHRLSINDLSELGNQPLNHPDDFNLTLICNGEIYNFKNLKNKYNFKTYSDSDCEIILHMYKMFGIKKTLEELDGVFSFVLHDGHVNKIYIARDPIGVRSMFLGINEDSLVVASEMKSITGLSKKIEQFKPGHYMEISDRNYKKYYDTDYEIKHIISDNKLSEKIIIENIRELLTSVVHKQLVSDRNIGCLLSGGLDSSLICGIVASYFNNKKNLKTFSVGLKGSVDLKYAKKVADYLGTDHYELIVTEDQMLNAIPDVIESIESYDTTTVRASTPMYLLSKYISETTDVKVILSGEGSDEASGSYMYFHEAPNDIEFKKESERLMTDLCFFDVLRCDKTISAFGLEARVPFLDKEFLNYYMSIEPKLKMPKTYKMEKYLLRKAFSDSKLIPDEVLWRSKEGMSDGVSSNEKGWYSIIQEYVDTQISEDEYINLKNNYSWNVPKTKESLYFREIFNKFYKNHDNVIPYYWLPKWCGDISEPSARVLNCYVSS